jgi:hypothetical protein
MSRPTMPSPPSRTCQPLVSLTSHAIPLLHPPHISVPSPRHLPTPSSSKQSKPGRWHLVDCQIHCHSICNASTTDQWPLTTFRWWLTMAMKKMIDNHDEDYRRDWWWWQDWWWWWQDWLITSLYRSIALSSFNSFVSPQNPDTNALWIAWSVATFPFPTHPAHSVLVLWLSSCWTCGLDKKQAIWPLFLSLLWLYVIPLTLTDDLYTSHPPPPL